MSSLKMGINFDECWMSNLKMRISFNEVWMSLHDLVRLSQCIPCPIFINEPFHRLLKTMPKGGAFLAHGHTKVDVVWEWWVIIRKIIRCNHIISTNIYYQTLILLNYMNIVYPWKGYHSENLRWKILGKDVYFFQTVSSLKRYKFLTYIRKSKNHLLQYFNALPAIFVKTSKYCCKWYLIKLCCNRPVNTWYKCVFLTGQNGLNGPFHCIVNT